MSVNKTVWLLVALAAPWCAFLPRLARADDLHVLELERFSMDYSKIENNRDIYYPYDDPKRSTDGEYWLYTVATNFNLDLIKYRGWGLFWSNRVQGDSTNTQFRAVSWQFRWGMQLGDRATLFYDHRSQHLLEQSPATRRTYPLENRVGIEINFYKRQP